MNQLKSYVGGSFAPPLSDELLDQYGKAISAMPGSAVKDAMEELLACCKKWWDIPESAHDPIMGAHPGSLVISLDQATKATLDPYVPYDDDVAHAQELFNKIDDGVDRSNPAIAMWMLDVRNIITEKHFPDAERFELLARAAKLDPGILSLFSVEAKAEVAEFSQRFAVFLASEYQRALATKSFEGHPYPATPRSPIKDMANHLLWHICELAGGDLMPPREPVTQDKLLVA